MGGPGKPPFWRTLKEFCKGLGSVALKSKHSTHPGANGNFGNTGPGLRLGSGCGGGADMGGAFGEAGLGEPRRLAGTSAGHPLEHMFPRYVPDATPPRFVLCTL